MHENSPQNRESAITMTNVENLESTLKKVIPGQNQQKDEGEELDDQF